MPAFSEPASPANERHGVGLVVFQPVLSQFHTLIERVVRQTQHVYVFINGPHSSEIDAICETYRGVIVLRSDVNVGQAAALNALMQRAVDDGCSAVALFDQDSLPSHDMLATLRTALARHRQDGRSVAAIGPRLLACDGYLPIRPLMVGLPSQSPANAVDFLPTSGSLISAEAWRAIGPFRADYFIGGVDVEWGYRAWAKGWSIILDETASMTHRWGEARRGGAFHPQVVRQSPWRSYLYVRNAVHSMTLRHMPAAWKIWQLSRFAVQLPLLALRRDFGIRLVIRAIGDGYRGRLGPADGVRAASAQSQQTLVRQ